MRFSRDILALNPHLSAPQRRTAASGVTDTADTLAAELARLAPDLPACVREYPVDRWRLDLAWPALRVCCEVDGGQHQAGGGRHGGQRDYAKTRALTLAGWLLLRFHAGEVRADPQRCIDDIREALALRGNQ